MIAPGRKPGVGATLAPVIFACACFIALLLGGAGILGGTVALADDALVPAGVSLSPEARIGRRIYREGTLPSGAPVSAVVQGDVPVDARNLSCEFCHRRSGLGTSEGTAITPALTGAALFQPREALLRQAYRSKAGSGQARPAYTPESLAASIRSGVDPNGRSLDALMPRYEIDDKSMDALTEYLRTLGGTDAPGVTDTKLHIATIVTEGVPEDQRAAMLAVLEGFVEIKNRLTRNEIRNAEKAPFYRKLPHRAYRTWQLHVWELEGESSSWTEQLHTRYARQPVFAVVNGIASDTWAPIHSFCAEAEVPCLFPHTDLPVADEYDFYSLYLSQGVSLEARALAQHLSTSPETGEARVVQVWEKQGIGATPARVLRTSLEEAERIEVIDVSLERGDSMSTQLARSLGRQDARPTVVVLWLSDPNLEALASLLEGGTNVSRVFLSSSIRGHSAAVPDALERLVNLIHPFDVPQKEDANLVRMDNWLKARGIERSDRRVQGDAYFAITFFGRAMKRMSQNFSREYLIEILEHALDNATFASVYPRVSLGPGQRFASKGSYILGLSAGDDPEWQPISRWITP